MSAASKAVAPPATPARADYGLDAPRRIRQMATRGALLILLGFGIWFMNRISAPGPGAALFAVFGVMGLGYLAAAGVMIWSSRAGKVAVRDRILDSIPWRGDEKVLDVGCGRGLFLIGAAQRISKPAKATGVDIWDAHELTGNSADAVMANARAEGVSDRVKVETGDAKKLPYSASTFDVVTSSLVFHQMHDETERDKAVRELWRVLKPGGHVAVFDVAYTDEYRKVLEKERAELVKQSGFSMLWMVPTTRWFIMRKPA